MRSNFRCACDDMAAVAAMYRFTRSGATWAVAVPDGQGGWRPLDGVISVHAGGRVVCVEVFEPIDLDALQVAWQAWWQATWGT
jgi:hypothetical protein